MAATAQFEHLREDEKTMKHTFIAALLLFVGAAAASAQNGPPEALMSAAQCLKAKGFLPTSNARSADFGYLIDSNAYPGKHLLYVVEYLTPSQSLGMVYAIFQRNEHGHEVLSIWNNAKFKSSERGKKFITFTEPPLGGIWTQTHLESAIKKIQLEQRFTISADDLRSITGGIRCESYADHH